MPRSNSKDKDIDIENLDFDDDDLSSVEVDEQEELEIDEELAQMMKEEEEKEGKEESEENASDGEDLLTVTHSLATLAPPTALDSPAPGSLDFILSAIYSPALPAPAPAPLPPVPDLNPAPRAPVPDPAPAPQASAPAPSTPAAPAHDELCPRVSTHGKLCSRHKKEGHEICGWHLSQDEMAPLRKIHNVGFKKVIDIERKWKRESKLLTRVKETTRRGREAQVQKTRVEQESTTVFEAFNEMLAHFQ